MFLMFLARLNELFLCSYQIFKKSKDETAFLFSKIVLWEVKKNLRKILRKPNIGRSRPCHRSQGFKFALRIRFIAKKSECEANSLRRKSKCVRFRFASLFGRPNSQNCEKFRKILAKKFSIFLH